MADDVKIVMFCCNWCSYGGADTAGTARMQYPPNIRVIRVMCSGRIDPQFVLKAFKEGADGVFVAGCHMGDCHYDAGNYKFLIGTSSKDIKAVLDVDVVSVVEKTNDILKPQETVNTIKR